MVDATMMEEFTDLRWNEVQRLAEETAEPFVTILLPTHERGAETRQDPIRLKNLLADAEKQLESAEQPTGILKEAGRLVDDHTFWQHQGKGLAVFVTPQSTRCRRLDHTVKEQCMVGTSAKISPLVPDLGSREDALVLTVTWEEADLLRLRGGSLEPYGGDEFPVSFDQLVTPRDPEEQLQYSSHKAGGANAGPGKAMFHGHGEGEQKIEADRKNYLRRVGERAVAEAYNRGLPMVGVATTEVLGELTSVSELSFSGMVEASPAELKPQEIEDRVGQLLNEHADRACSEFKERLGTAVSQQQGTTDVDQVARAALEGRIDQLLVAGDASAFGTVNPVGFSIHETGSESDTDLVNLAVLETVKHGGQVNRVAAEEMPIDGSMVAAIFRF